MADFIRIDLDSVKKFRNGQEWRWVNRAASGDFVSVGDGRNIVKVSKMLVDAGADPAKEVRVFRGDMLCMSGASLGVWADGKFGRRAQPEQLKGAQNG